MSYRRTEQNVKKSGLNSTFLGNNDAPTPIAIIGIPAGLEVRHDALKELVGAARFSAYEVIGREVILYWHALKAGERRIIPISLIAAIPATFTGPASRAYLYYIDGDKQKNQL